MNARAYYNEHDAFAAAWLRNLIAAGLIAPGDVDERDIRDVLPSDLDGYAQCHFFAGIGVWSYALRLAGWRDDRPVWTGSCPCQPFSAAGRGGGFADERHLWPHWHHLIRECRPSDVAGEQVASSAVGPWIDLVQDDMEALGYAFGAVSLPAASVGAPHIRDRSWWMAYDVSERWERRQRLSTRRVADRENAGRAQSADGPFGVHEASAVFIGNAERFGLRGEGYRPDAGAPGGMSDQDRQRERLRDDLRPTVVDGFWFDADWLPCRDGKARPVEPGTFPLAHGAPARVGRLRAYGNAIVPQVAAEFIMTAAAAISEVSGARP